MLAAVDMQQHAGQRPSLAPLAMNPALAPLGHQSGNYFSPTG